TWLFPTLRRYGLVKISGVLRLLDRGRGRSRRHFEATHDAGDARIRWWAWSYDGTVHHNLGSSPHHSGLLRPSGTGRRPAARRRPRVIAPAHPQSQAGRPRGNRGPLGEIPPPDPAVGARATSQGIPRRARYKRSRAGDSAARRSAHRLVQTGARG